MPFIQMPATARVGASGRKDARIALVGEAPSHEELKQGKPFVGKSGSVLEQCLHSAGLTRHELYITNLFKEFIGKNKNTYYYEKKVKGKLTPFFTEKGQAYVEELRQELSDCSANIIVPLGGPAAAALTGRAYISTYRGYVTEGALLPGRKILPTLHPANVIWGNYLSRYYIMHDLMKAKKESNSPEFGTLYRRVQNEDGIYLTDTCDEALQLLRSLDRTIVACDIEATNYEVSYISFADKTGLAFSICFYYNQMSVEQEAAVWLEIARLLEDPSVVKVFQNAAFDIQFLAERQRILVKGRILDTMIAHSIMYPEFEKNLGFIGSIYTDMPYWKDKVTFKSIKKED